ncbi:Uncharacterised protein [Mobiluncus curtisii]|uniref:Uncharacterized protein n=1 Tax=Mobiluncus curtisii TaxID=2051 RepID=A0A2X2YM22_9ACTO|nr:Uncharacterised protein [Mobiluncus curtisii]
MSRRLISVSVQIPGERDLTGVFALGWKYD